MTNSPSLDPERKLLQTRICDLGLSIAGSWLEPSLAQFRRELVQAGIVRLEPDFYLSDEWGVLWDSISIAIPFYLARADLLALHLKLAGFVEGAGRGDFLRYLRHEMGHVVNYAYRLYARPDWTALFGDIEKDYEDSYRPLPFCAEYVWHLPGWYAQKHPDEDWAETFAVWLTPGTNWKTAYARWPTVLRKLEFCDRVMQTLGSQKPEIAAVDHDEDVSTLTATLQAFYDNLQDDDEPAGRTDPVPVGLDRALQGIFEDLGDYEDVASTAPRLPAADLIRRLEPTLVANAYRWTGHFPEEVRPLVRQLAARADDLKQVYPADRETQAVAALATLVAALAMNHITRGSYLP